MAAKTKSNATIPGYAQVRQHVYSLIASRPEDKSKPLTTEKELCELFGMARGTIRRALSSLEEEGMLIRRQHYGTFVNPSFAAAMMQQLPHVGIVIGNGNYAFFDNYEVSMLRGALGAMLGANSYTHVLQFNDDPEKALKLFKMSGGCGLLWLGSDFGCERDLEFLKTLKMPVVMALPACSDDAFDSIEIDYCDYGYRACKALFKKGFKRILFLDNNSKPKVDEKRRGCQEAFKEAELPWDESLWVPASISDTRARVEELLSLPEPPQAIQGPSPFARIVSELLVKHPEIHSFLSGTSLCQSDEVSIAAPTESCGEAGMRMLLDRISGKTDGPPVKIKVKMDIQLKPEERQ